MTARMGLGSFITATALLALTTAIGCGSGDDKGVIKAPPKKDAKENEDHGHELGPHGGEIVEFGEERHGEVIIDPANHKVTVYLLDESTKNPLVMPVDHVMMNYTVDDKAAAPATLPAVSKTEKGASQFEVVDKALCAALEDPEKAKAHVKIHLAKGELDGHVKGVGRVK